MNEFPRSRWRLIYSPPANGAWNMALDEAILEAVGQGVSPATLRLYAWEPPCLSLGYAQPFADADLAAIQFLDWDIVRRPTGGRAILHTDELTYAVIGPQDDPRLSGRLLRCYRILAQALLDALHRLDIPAEAQAKPEPLPGNPSPQAAAQGPVCFEVPSDYEITVSGKKLIGSAQARRKEGVLQHGSLPLHGDLARVTQVLKFSDPKGRPRAAERLPARATTVESVLGRAPDWQATARAFADAFRDTLNLDLLPAEPSDWEMERAQQLVEEKFANPGWTERV